MRLPNGCWSIRGEPEGGSVAPAVARVCGFARVSCAPAQRLVRGCSLPISSLGLAGELPVIKRAFFANPQVALPRPRILVSSTCGFGTWFAIACSASWDLRRPTWRGPREVRGGAWRCGDYRQVLRESFLMFQGW